MREDGDPRSSLKPQPGQYNSYNPKFKPLPGQLAKEQLNGNMYKAHRSSRTTNGSRTSSKPETELKRALAAEKSRIEASMKQQGIIPGKAIYENPRETQNTLLPTEKYANG